MASFRVIATGLLLLVILAHCEARRPTLSHESNATVVTPQAGGAPCHPIDINVQQGEVSGVGIPIWEVQVINQCTNPLCAISQVIVQCGAFHSSTFVNPKVFRRLDTKAGTCIVNDGNVILNAETVTFQYSEIVKQPMTLKSAKVVCR